MLFCTLATRDSAFFPYRDRKCNVTYVRNSPGEFRPFGFAAAAAGPPGSCRTLPLRTHRVGSVGAGRRGPAGIWVKHLISQARKLEARLMHEFLKVTELIKKTLRTKP